MRGPTGVTATETSGPEPLFPALTRVMQESEASVGMIYLLSPGDDVLRLAVETGVSQELAAPWASVGLSDIIPVADAARERRQVWLGSQEEVANRYPRVSLVLPYDFVLLAHPVQSGDTVLGGLVLLWPGFHSSDLSAREQEAIHSCCDRLGQVLKRGDSQRLMPEGARPRVLTRAHGRVPGPVEAMAGAEFIERLPGGCCALDLEGRITFITDTASDLVGAPRAMLLGAVPWEVLPWLNDPAFEDRYRAAAVSRRPTSFTAMRPPQHWLSFRLYPTASGVSVRIIPVSADKVPEMPELERPASPPMPSRAGALYHLMHLAATLTEAVGVQDVIAQTADQLMPVFGAQALALMTTEEGRLRVRGYRGYDAAFMSHFDGVPLTSDIPSVHVLKTGVPSFFASFAELRRAHPSALHLGGMNAWAFVPLIASGHTIGSLLLAYDQPHAFAPADRTILVSLAGLIAQAVDRARLYDAEHQMAQSLQAALLPHTLAGIPGLEVAARYLPATSHMAIGGDFYDLIRLDDTSAAVTIGDVQGHNVQAAALMGQVRAAVHATAGAPPGEVLARTNRLLTDLNPGLFTSCLYAHLDLVHHRAHLATAGHPPPLLRHPDGRTQVLHLTPGLLLGIDSGAEYEAAEIALPPGTVLALYTDGVIETPGIDLGDSTEDLAAQLSRAGDESMDALADTLLRYSKRTAPRNDDMALLLVKALSTDG